MSTSFVFTVLFLLLGPIKLLAGFGAVTQGRDESFTRAVALRASAIGLVVVAFVALLGEELLARYQISLAALGLAGGLVLLLSALRTMFPSAAAAPIPADGVSALHFAASPVVTPIMIPPAGVAAILIFMMMASRYPWLPGSVAISLAIIMVLDLLVMYFNRQILRVAGVTLVLQVLGAVLVFMQAALAIDTMLSALVTLGVLPAS